MARVFYVHWHKDEAAQTVRDLREAGHTVNVHWDVTQGAGNDAWNKIRAAPPEALVVSLAKLPSHGRRIAQVTQETKKLRDVPVIFVDGEKDKVAVTKQQFPEAKFISSKKLIATLEKVAPPGTGSPAPGSSAPAPGSSSSSSASAPAASARNGAKSAPGARSRSASKRQPARAGK